MSVEVCRSVPIADGSFAGCTEPFGHGYGRCVLGSDHADGCRPPEQAVRRFEGSASSFGGIALAVVSGDESPGDLGFDPPIGKPRSGQAHEPTCRRFCDCPRTVSAQHPMAGIDSEFPPRVFSLARPAVETRNGICVKRCHRFEVRVAQRPKRQPRGVQYWNVGGHVVGVSGRGRRAVEFPVGCRSVVSL